MENITVDIIKDEYPEISQLVNSLDEHKKIVLKSRDEIYQNIKSKPLRTQKIMVDQLLDIFNIEAISDTCLNPKEKKGWCKPSFDMFCNTILKPIKSQIKALDFFEDEKRIESIKGKLNILKSKEEKINYLLNLRNQLRGDYTNEIKDILEKDDYYLFIIDQLDYWERYKTIEINSAQIEPQLLRLQTNLTTDTRAQLFTELVNGKFIPNENQDCFNWAITVTDEEEPKHPGQWQPIKWEKTKGLLAYFVDVFNIEILGNDGNTKRTQWKPFEIIFGQNKLRGAKNDYQKTGNLPEGYKQIDIIIKSVINCK